MNLLSALQATARVVLLDYYVVSKSRASYNAAQKEQLCRENTDASSDFPYFIFFYKKGCAATHFLHSINYKCTFYLLLAAKGQLVCKWRNTMLTTDLSILQHAPIPN